MDGGQWKGQKRVRGAYNWQICAKKSLMRGVIRFSFSLVVLFADVEDLRLKESFHFGCNLDLQFFICQKTYMHQIIPVSYTHLTLPTIYSV